MVDELGRAQYSKYYENPNTDEMSLTIQFTMYIRRSAIEK